MRAALYIRVSTTQQEAANQELALHDYCQKAGLEVTGKYIDLISGAQTKRPAYDSLFADAHKHLFDVVVFWALDRFSRGGTLFTLQKLKELENLGIGWDSYQEPYFKSAGQFRDVVISIMSTLAKLERERISERTKAGLMRAKASGSQLGRPKGSKDRKERRKLGYFRRWDNGKRQK